jgi:antitoxin component YwqK of YwqJK toxin-antitoxin module
VGGDGTLQIAEILYESGAVKHRYSRYRSEDGSRWVRHGLFESYSAEGVLTSQVQYSDGVEEGPSRDFHPNGEVAAEGEYRAGKEHGHWRFYSPSGGLQEEVLYEAGVEVSRA